MDENNKKIHPMLLAKLRALHSIFFDQWRQVPLYRFPTFSSFAEPIMDAPSTQGTGNLKDLVSDDDSGDETGEGGGGGTIKGLRVEKTPTKLTRN